MSKEWDWEEFDSWNEKEFEDKYKEEITTVLNSLSLLVNTCTENLTTDQLKEVDSHFEFTITQCKFWEKQKNIERLIYDLRQLGTWLCDFISDAEKEFWKDK